MKRRIFLLMLLAADILTFILTACSGHGGVVWSGENNLETSSFTGEFHVRFDSVSEPYILVETELEEAKVVHVTCKGTVDVSGNLEPFHLICKTGDDERVVLLENKDKHFGAYLHWSAEYDDDLTLQAGTNRITLYGDAANLELDLEITEKEETGAI